MKNLLPKLIAMLLLAASFTNAIAQKKAKTQKLAPLAVASVFSTPDSVFHFGKIDLGKPVSTSFIFTNNNNKPMLVKHVSTSCGCTTPTWNKQPVMPGKSTTIEVGYNAASAGRFYKTVTVFYDKDNQKNIYIEGEVLP